MNPQKMNAKSLHSTVKKKQKHTTECNTLSFAGLSTWETLPQRKGMIGRDPSSDTNLISSWRVGFCPNSGSYGNMCSGIGESVKEEWNETLRHTDGKLITKQLRNCLEWVFLTVL